MADETTTEAPAKPAKAPAKPAAAKPAKAKPKGFGKKNRPKEHSDVTAGFGGSFKFVNGARVPA